MNSDDVKLLKAGLIVSLVTAVTVLHYYGTNGDMEMHVLHRELYFIPILLASFWFGLKHGLLTAVVISLIYAPYIFLSRYGNHSVVVLAAQILVFILVGLLLGWLSDRQRKLQEGVLRDEKLAVLGQAAAIVGHEMIDNLKILKKALQPTDARPSVTTGRDIQLEIGRLETMAEVVSSFAKPEHLQIITNDLNPIVAEVVHQYQARAQRDRVSLVSHLDEEKCPARIDVERVKRIIGGLIENALDVSTSGQSIHISTERGSAFCRIQVRDEGPGIPPEHLPKMFSPFFTTKEDGSGLALSSSQYVLRKLGGDLEVEPERTRGASFAVKIPRDLQFEDIAEDALSFASKSR